MTIINMYTPNKRPSEILNLKNITCWSWLGKSVVWLLLWWRSCVEAQLSGVETWTPATWVWTSAISWTPWMSCLHFLSVPSSMKWCCHSVYVQGWLSDGAQCLVENNYGRYYAVISSSLFSSDSLVRVWHSVPSAEVYLGVLCEVGLPLLLLTLWARVPVAFPALKATVSFLQFVCVAVPTAVWSVAPFQHQNHKCLIPRSRWYHLHLLACFLITLYFLFSWATFTCASRWILDLFCQYIGAKNQKRFLKILIKFVCSFIFNQKYWYS